MTMFPGLLFFSIDSQAIRLQCKVIFSRTTFQNLLLQNSSDTKKERLGSAKPLKI